MADSQERAWVEAWARAGPALERLRGNALRQLDTVAAVAALGDAFDLAIRQTPSRPTSGLVEQQRWFLRLRRG